MSAKSSRLAASLDDKSRAGNVTLPRYHPVEPAQRLWTVEDVAAFLRVPAATIRKWRHCGHPLGRLGVRIGKRVVWDPRDVLAWWEQAKKAAASDQAAVVKRRGLREWQ